MSTTTAPKFQVNQLGAGFIPLGGWYWCHVGPNGFPTEALNTHGPFLFRCLAVRAARRAT